MDTAADLRLRFYAALAERLSRLVRSGTVRDPRGAVRRLSSLVKEVMYSYLEPEEIVGVYALRFEEIAEDLRDCRTGSESARRLIEYVAQELNDFRRKFSRPCRRPYEVFRYAIVDIVSVSRHPTLQNLRVTRARDGRGNVYTVVTNLDVKGGERAAIVFLPPREFGKVWSEAMFVKVGIAGPEDVTEEDLKEVEAKYAEIISS